MDPAIKELAESRVRCSSSPSPREAMRPLSLHVQGQAAIKAQAHSEQPVLTPLLPGGTGWVGDALQEPPEVLSKPL